MYVAAMGGFHPWRNWVDKFSSNLAFYPPPPTYSLVEVAQGQDWRLVSSTESIHFEHTVKVLTTRPTRKGGYGVKTSVVAAFIPYKQQGQHAEVTMLCSHGNAVDLGQMMPIYRELSQILHINIMGYDYSGYGCSTGLPTASQTYADISAVFDSLVGDFGIPINQIVLYGQSVGSGPTSWLAAQEQELGGVILHSPLLSGVRVLHPNLSFWPACLDVFPNHLLIPKVKAPCLVMHGDEDTVIHVSCGQQLAKLAKNPFPPLWAKGFNHQNVEACPLYVPTLISFISAVRGTRK